MLGPNKRPFVNAFNGSARSEANGTSLLRGELHEQDERIMTRRADMLRCRQVDLDGLMANHDDLVREAFQLDKFVTLLSYDPKVAKQDNSQVFLQYKAPHDLMANSATASGSGQNLRKTRRATTEFRETLAATISAPASHLTAAPSSMTKGKGKARATSGPDFTSPNRKNTVRTKVEAKAIPITATASPMAKGKGRESFDALLPDSAGDIILPPPLPRLSKRSHRPRRVKGGAALKKQDVLGPSAPLTTDSSRNVTRKGLSSSAKDSHPFVGGMERDAGLEKRIFPDHPDPPKSVIKRIRLFQRPPQAVYTHPSQLPPRPQHGGSLQDFLNSYFCLEDGRDLPYERLEHMSSAEAKTRARIRDLKKEGRLMLDIPELPDGSCGIPSLAVPEQGVMREFTCDRTHYDHLVSAVAHRGRMIANEYTIRKGTAKKVARLVMAWHGNKEGTEDKQRKAEAARMRTLAKFTVKEVEKQWRKAVMAVREQNRAVLEAEEARLGRKHLDAILDQSGVILEAQHIDLSRARSRSSSARDWSGTDGSEDDEVEPVETDEEMGIETGGEESEEYPEDGEDDDVALLLGTEMHGASRSRAPSSEAETESLVVEDEAVHPHLPSLGDTPPSTSDSFLDPPLTNDDIGISLFAAPSQVVPDDHSTTGAKTIPSPISIADDSRESVDKQDIAPGHTALERHRLDTSSMTTNYKSVVPVGEMVSSDEVHPRKGYRMSTSPAGSHHTMSDTTSPPPADSILPPSPSELASPHSRPPGPSNGSSATPTSGSVVPSNAEAEYRPELNGRSSVPVRLSNGVIIYHDSDAPSSFEAARHILPPSEASKDLNGHLSDTGLGITTETSNVTPTKETIPSVDTEAAETDKVDDVEPSARLSVDRRSKSPPSMELPTAMQSEMEAEVEAASAASSPDLDGEEDITDDESRIAPHLRDFAATPVDWDPSCKVNPPFLLRGTLRPYQHSGLEWLASLHTNGLNGILADEMGLGKTIQTISLLAHLACDLGIWGPHLIVVPTSVLLNWEMEFKKFLPGFKILPYHGSAKRRKELRIGWNNKHSFNVCVTSYTLASRDAHIFKRKAWYYMILDEAHMIKNFKSQRWNTLLMFRSFRRLLLTGTPLQNNLTELWALLQFLMSGTNFANLKEFGDWFSNPLEKAIEQGTTMDDETQERVRKLHTVLRPYLLRRLKADVEKELPSKFEHLVICRLSKRQRFLYDEFMSRAQTRDALASRVYHKVANILMQLRKVCNHPDLFEVRPIVTSFAMSRSAIADFETKELLVRRRLLQTQSHTLNLDLLGLVFTQHQGKSMMQARSTSTLDASSCLPFVTDLPGEPPPVDTQTIKGFKRRLTYDRQLATLHRWTQLAYTNRLRCAASPVYGSETISVIRQLYTPLVPLSEVDYNRPDHLDRSRISPALIKSYRQRAEDLAGIVDRFVFVTPAVVARDMPFVALSGSQIVHARWPAPGFDNILHHASVKLQIAFPDASLIQYDCGKLQELASLLHQRKAGGHRVLIFTQMTKVLDILEIFLNFHGYRYLRLDGATKIEDRQYITERFNDDARVFAFIASSRSGGVGINLTGADTVVFYDSDFNPQMDRQCEDRAHRIGQIRDVHIYRFISEHTVEESMLRKANQKRSLDNIVIQQGEFDWRSLLIDDEAFGKALGEFEDKEDAHAARVAAREEAVKEVEDRADFTGETDDVSTTEALQTDVSMVTAPEEEEEGTVADYMLAFVNRDWEWFSTMR